MLFAAFIIHFQIHHVHLVLIEPRHEEDYVLRDVTRIDGALPHHLAHHCIVVEEHLHLIVEAVPDVVYALADDSAQLGLDAFGRPKLVLAYTYQCLLREV